MEALNTVLKFFFDSSVSLYKRAMAIILIVALLWVLDSILGATDFFFVKQKTKTITEINTLLKENTLDSQTKQMLADDLKYISQKQSLRRQISSFFAKTFNLMNSNKSSITNDSVSILERIFSSLAVYFLLLIDLYIDHYDRLRKKHSKKKIFSWVFYYILPSLIAISLLINSLPVINLFGLGRLETNVIYQAISLILTIIALSYLVKKRIINLEQLKKRE